MSKNLFFYTTSNEKKINLLMNSKKNIILNQVHGNKIVILKNKESIKVYQKNKNSLYYDGVITNQKNISLLIKHADCAPVFLSSQKGEIIGALHCGWRSVKKGIIEEAKLIFQKEFNYNQKIFFSIGPTICEKCYVVQSDLIKKFKLIFRKYKLTLKNYFNQDQKRNVYLFNLKKLIKKISLLNGFTLEKISNTCTLENKNLFSYRENKTSLRNISIIKKDK